MGQSRTIIGRENVVHCMQTMCAYNAPKPEQKTVQVKDHSALLSYQHKPLPQPPKRETNSMNVTCYKCGQVGHIWTNCPCLTKMRTAAVRADGTEDPEMDPQDEQEVVNIKKNNLMYTWSHSINGILRKKRKQMITLFLIEPKQAGLHWIQKSK